MTSLRMTPAARRITLALLATMYGFGFIDRIVIALVAQQIKAEYRVTDFEIGLLGGTAFAVVNVVAAVPLARLAERRARKWVTAGALMIASLFTVVAGMTNSFAHLLIARLGMAAGSAGTEAPPHSMISDLYEPERRASAISLFMLGIPVAALLGSFVGGRIAESHGWRATFLVIGAGGAAVALVAMLLVREPARMTVATGSKPAGIGRIFGVLLRDRMLRQVLAGVSVISLGSFGMNTFLPSFFSRTYLLGAGDAGLLFGLLSGVASALGTLAGGFGAEFLARRDPRLLIAVPGIGAMIGAPLFVAGLMQDRLPVAFALMLAGSMFFYMAMGPAIAAVHGALDSRSRATGSALFLLIVHLTGQGLGPPIAGAISDALSAAVYGAPDFAARCAGAAGQVAGTPCAAAAASGLRWAIACFGGFYLWAALHLLLAARNMGRRDA